MVATLVWYVLSVPFDVGRWHGVVVGFEWTL